MRPQSVVAPSGDCYDVEAGMALFAGKTVCSMPERIEVSRLGALWIHVTFYLYLCLLGMGAVNRKTFGKPVSKLTELKPKMADKMAARLKKLKKIRKWIEYYNQFNHLPSSVVAKTSFISFNHGFDTLSNCEGCLIRPSEAKPRPTSEWWQPWWSYSFR